MRRSGRRVRAVMLVELMVLVLIMVAVAGMLTALLCDGLHLQRRAALRADRLAVSDSLVHELRLDAFCAVACHLDGSALTLETVSRDGRQEVHYAIDTQRVVRTADGVETHVWHAVRLEFAARLERGPRGNVLHVELIEQPPPGSDRRRPRSVTVPVLLPTEASR